MLNQKEILSTIAMIDQQHLDIRTITMGISLLSCCDPDAKKACDKIYEKITRYAEKLVKTGEDIQHEFGIPIVNKRISVTPMALVAGASETEDYVLRNGAGPGGKDLRRQLYRRLFRTGAEGNDPCRRKADPLHSGGPGPDGAGVLQHQRCSTVPVSIMDAVKLMGRIIKDTAARTADRTVLLRQAGGVLQRRGG